MSNNMMVLVMEYFNPQKIKFPHVYRTGVVPKDVSLLKENLGEILPAMSVEYTDMDVCMKSARDLDDEWDTEYGVVINNYGTLSSADQQKILAEVEKPSDEQPSIKGYDLNDD